MFIKYGFLADTITFDQLGKPSAIGIFEVIYAPKFPTIHRDMSLLANLEGRKHDIYIHVEFHELTISIPRHD